MSDGRAVTQDFLDNNQYSRKSILKYERIFGHSWVSSGGEKTTRAFCIRLKLRPGMKILDVGCGTGGSAFFFARYFGVEVTGIDLSSNMIRIANGRREMEEDGIRNRVTFLEADAILVDFPPLSFDVIYSRDTILHIKDKEGLYAMMLPWLKPNGQLLVTDYCKGDIQQTQAFLEYWQSRDYDLRTVAEYGAVLSKCGYKNVEAKDCKQLFLDILKEELEFFVSTKEAFIKDFCEADYEDLAVGWAQKVDRVTKGEQVWGYFYANK